ncbi:3-methyl-2-oxobutanoate hydroxymethyltransferase [Caldicellulosiruptor morganii]|uniref:3-methyl-2-oxobutanoate hydroxymethyltransferase n=1 Tax=Caldicellulosiruptor morganii TaxID=1387555 RepID=A0ABY7BL86_9FIRM|nr:3-methyl-2-oxobutanoate hydroxymethyltransferase [Caldicellulosiruptor morganii]WAM33260.1 3-methyl-2-oxobutanoate hydroxymethyltransferase [Caldicellulosiruptor morganii]
MNRVTTKVLMEKKQRGEKITMLTAYDYTFAKLFDSCMVDILLVGDSLGMVILGYDSTIPVTMDDMEHHVKAVARGTKYAMVVADMPFLSYHTTPEEAVKNAGRLIRAGAYAVKMEGCDDVLDKIEAVLKAQIPVMGHLGLTPQSVNVFGGYDLRAKEEEEAKKLIEDAKKLEKAGVFAIVLEKVPAMVAKQVQESVKIPVIGIGAGPYCDGQVLVCYDMLGMYEDFKPRFVKRYAEIGSAIKDAVSRYIDEVKKGEFPGKEHSY